MTFLEEYGTMDRLSKEHRSWNMSRIPGKNTGPEKSMRSMLHRRGYRFRVQEIKLPGKPDIVLPKYKTAIFVHGCFWHAHQGCQFKRTIQRDQEQMLAISKSGWLPLVIWECEIKGHPTTTLNKVHKILQRRLMKILIR